MIRGHQKKHRDKNTSWLKNGENSPRLNWIQRLLHQQRGWVLQNRENVFVAESKVTLDQLLMCAH